ncbi:MAG: helix-turn-helix transcriptional regulator [Anaerostipes faecalis]|nr:helix-turn-helix transcriptional regulator [Anaerostipes faecalis]
MTKKSTDDLLNIISQESDMEQVLLDISDELVQTTLSEELNRLLHEKKLKKSQVIQDSNLSADYVYQIFSGRKKDPSRDKVLALGFGLGLSKDEMQYLLKVCGFSPLYPRLKREAIILFALKEKQSIHTLNDWLYEKNLLPLTND